MGVSLITAVGLLSVADEPQPHRSTAANSTEELRTAISHKQQVWARRGMGGLPQAEESVRTLVHLSNFSTAQGPIF